MPVPNTFFRSNKKFKQQNEGQHEEKCVTSSSRQFNGTDKKKLRGTAKGNRL